MDDHILVRTVDVLGQRVIVAIIDVPGGFGDMSDSQVLMVGVRIHNSMPCSLYITKLVIEVGD